MPGQRRSVGAAKQRAGSSGGTGPTGNNNASDIMLWAQGADYYQIIQKETFGSAVSPNQRSLTQWNDLRKTRGTLLGAANGNILSISYTPYHFYDGTTTNAGPAPYDNWVGTERAWLPTTGHFATYTAAHAPAGGSGVNKTFGWRTGFGTGTKNYNFGSQVAFQPWHDDAAWGSSGAAAAITAGQGSAAWAAAVASALTPNSAAYGPVINNVQRTLLWDWTLLCRTAAAFGFTQSLFDPESNGDTNSGGWGTQNYTNNPGYNEAQIRLLIKLRGQQMATVQANEMPGSDTGVYYQKIPGSYSELSYRRALGASFEGFGSQGTAYFIAGWATVSGIRRVFTRDATFYKGAGYHPSTYDNAYRYDHMGTLAFLSTLFTDAERKAGMERLALTSAIWPTNGVSGNEVGNGMSVAAFQDALRAAVKWNMGGGRAGDTRPGQVTIFAAGYRDDNSGSNTSTDHTPYEAAFQAEAVPGIADAVPPVVTCTQGASSAGSAATIVLSGTITDNLAPYRVDVTNAANGATYGCQWTRVVTFPGWNPVTTDMVSNDITQRGDWFSPPIPVAVGANVITIDGYDTHDNKVTITHTYTRDPDLLSLFQSRYPATGAEIWVDGTLGNDNNAGTPASPKATIQAAINVSVAGSKIMVRPYAPGYAVHTFAGHSGNANNYIQMIASGATSAFSPGAKINVNGGVNPGQQGVGMIGNANFIAMFGFELGGLNSVSAEYEVGVMVANGAHDVAVWCCYFHDLASHAFAAPGDGGQGWAGSDRIDVCYNRITRTSRWNRYQGSGISMISQANLGGAWADGYRNHIIGNVIDNVFTDPNTFLTPPYVTDGNGMIFDISGGYAGRTLVAHNLTVGCGGRGIHTLSFDHIDAWLNTSCDCIQNLPGTWVGEFSIQGSSDCRFGWNVGAAKVGSNRVGNFESPGTSTWSDTVYLRGTGGSQANDPSVNSFNNINKTGVGPAAYFNQYQQGSYQNTVITNVAGFRPKLAQVVTGNPPANIRAAVAPWPDALGVLRPASGPWAYGAFEAA